MKYDRLGEIYMAMGYEMQDRFIAKYQIIHASSIIRHVYLIQTFFEAIT